MPWGKFMNWDPDFIADEFIAIMLNLFTRDEMAYLHITVMHPSYEV